MTREEAISVLEERLLCTRYVDSEYVDCVNIEAIQMAIEALKERPHGEWIYDMFDENYHCSECNRVGATILNFCPNCGASMISSNSEIEKSKSEIVPDYRDGWRLKEGEAE